MTNTFVAPVTLSVGTSSNSNSVFAGSIQDGVGTLSLNKLGSATLALTGTNTFSGLLTISKGAVLITNPASLSTNATLSGDGSASTAGTLLLGAAGNYNVAGIAVPGLLKVNNLTVTNTLTNDQTLIVTTNVTTVGSQTLTVTGNSYVSGSANKSIYSATNVTVIFNGPIDLGYNSVNTRNLLLYGNNVSLSSGPASGTFYLNGPLTDTNNTNLIITTVTTDVTAGVTNTISTVVTNGTTPGNAANITNIVSTTGGANPVTNSSTTNLIVGGLNAASNSIVTLGASNNYSGTNTITSGGRMIVSPGANLGSTKASIFIGSYLTNIDTGLTNQATLNLGGNSLTNNNLTITNGLLTNGTLTLSSATLAGGTVAA